MMHSHETSQIGPSEMMLNNCSRLWAIIGRHIDFLGVRKRLLRKRCTAESLGLDQRPIW